jgi:hypothetical protein
MSEWPDLRDGLIGGARLGYEDVAVSVLVGRPRSVGREHQVPAAPRALLVDLLYDPILGTLGRVIGRHRHAHFGA